MPSLSNNDIGINISTTADTSGITQTEREVENLSRAHTEASKSTVNWGSEFTKAGALATGLLAPIGLVTKASIDQAATYEQSRVSFETMLGSADAAKSLLKQLSDFAASTPFDLPQVVEGSKNLLAFGVAQDDVIGTFKTLGNIASGVGTEKLPGLITVFGQVKAAGRMMTQDMLQFTSAGVPMIDLLSQHFGIAKDKVKDYVESGKVKFDDLKSSLELLGGPAGKWGDLMDKQSKTFSGSLSNVSDNIGRVLRQAVGIGPDGDIRKGSLFDMLTKGAASLADGITRIQPTLDNIIKFFEQNHSAVAALAGAIGGLLLGVIVAIVVAIGWIPIAIVGATMAIGALVSYVAVNFENIKRFVVGVWESIKNKAKEIFNTISQDIGDALTAIKNTFNTLYDNVRKTIQDVINLFVRHKDGLRDIGIVIGTFVLPMFGKMMFSAATTATATIVDAARMSAAWVVSAAQTSVAWVTQTLPEIISGAAAASASGVTAAIRMGIAFVVQAAQTTAAWIVSFASFAAGVAVMVAQFLVQAARMAAGWLLALGPIGLVVAVAIGAAALIITHWDQVKSFLGSVWNFIKAAGDNLYKDLTVPFVEAGSAIINAIGGAWRYMTGLNWGAIVGGIGRGMGNAIVDLVNGAIRGAFSDVPVLKDHIPQLPHFYKGVRNFGGGLAVVGDVNGAGGEIIDLPKGSNVYTNQESKQMLNGGLGNGVTVTQNIYNQLDYDRGIAEIGFMLRTR